MYGLSDSVQVCLYEFLFSPVKHVPGPWWALVSKIPLLHATWQQHQSQHVSDTLHKYGQLAVITLDQVHNIDKAIVKIIYTNYPPRHVSMQAWGPGKESSLHLALLTRAVLC